MKFLEILKTNSKILDAKLEASIPYNHKGVKGTCREEDLIDVIRDCLPNCYGLKSGEIFDQYNEISNQIDVVIYDNVYSNYFKKDSSASLFPCESVYGSIEVKSYLNKKDFLAAIDNIKSVRKLKREESKYTDITPNYRLNIEGSIINGPQKKNEYLSIIFAYDSISAKNICSYLKELEEEDIDLLPTLIYVHKQGIIYTKVQLDNSDSSHTRTSFGMNHEKNDAYTITNYGEDSLTVFFILLNSMLSQIILKNINYASFHNQFIDNLKKTDTKLIEDIL